MDDLVGPFPDWSKLPLGWILCSWRDFAQNKVSYVKSSKLHSLVVVFDHLLLVFRHLLGCSVSYFVQEIQVDSQLIFIAVFTKSFSSHAGDSYFNWNYCLGAIGEPEGRFSCRDPCCSPICPQDMRQFL